MSTNLNKNVNCRIENNWTAKMLEEYFLEVIATLKKLPPVKQRGYFSFWPSIIYSANELLFQEKVPKQLKATSEAVSRLDKSFEWMAWLLPEERKLIWRRAAKTSWISICKEFGYSRITAWRKWNFALEKLARKLNQRKENRAIYSCIPLFPVIHKSQKSMKQKCKNVIQYSL